MSRSDPPTEALLAALHEAASSADDLHEAGDPDNGAELQQAIEDGEALWQQIQAASRWASLPEASRAQAFADAAAVLSIRASVIDDTPGILSALGLGESALRLASVHAPELIASLHAELAAIARALPAGSYQITNLTGGNSVNAIASDGLIELKLTAGSAAAYKALVTAVTKAAAEGAAAENAFRGVKTGDLTSGAPATVRSSVTPF